MLSSDDMKTDDIESGDISFESCDSKPPRGTDKSMNQTTRSSIAEKPFESCDSKSSRGTDKNMNQTTRSSISENPPPRQSRTAWMLAALIVIIGLSVSSILILTGVRSAFSDETLRFEKEASELTTAVETTWKDYELAGLWIHEACRSTGDHAANYDKSSSICSRSRFRDVYDYVTAGGLEFTSIAFCPNVTDEFRSVFEQEAAAYYDQNFPYIPYYGFTGFEFDDSAPGGYSFQPRSKQPFYFPTHLIEPVSENAFLLDFDMYASGRSWLVDSAVQEWKPVASNPIRSIPPATGRYIILLHPGIKVSGSDLVQSDGFSSVTIPFEAFIKRAAIGRNAPIKIYIFDYTEKANNYTYMYGGATLQPNPDDDGETEIALLEETDMASVKRSHSSCFLFEKEIKIAQQTWTIVVTTVDHTHKPNLFPPILIGILAFLTCLCLAFITFTKIKRDAKIAHMQNAADTERSALIVENAEKSVEAERRLNDYLAHEVRNPLSAAMSACSFLSAAHHDDPTGRQGPSVSPQEIREDIQVVHSSLHFINDLLRCTLDGYRASNNQMELEKTSTDMLKDIFEPIKTILHRRDNTFDIIIECPENMVVLVDRMRVKQIVLNLSNNASKFVKKGFIRLRAEELDGMLRLSVEDSGPGIPKYRRPSLFSRFQKSLDSLHQGTGMGLSLCKSLVDLMEGSLSLDEDYNSGVEGCIGSRFVILLPTSFQKFDEHFEDSPADSFNAKIASNTNCPAKSKSSSNLSENTEDISANDFDSNSSVVSIPKTLPKELNVLVVDDDLIIRKMLSRSIKRVAPGWSIQEAANGETALTLVDRDNYDLIFMDQYMASAEKQLLGTETTYALRAKGVTARICGLSANDMKESFVKSGADAFMSKPFPCDKEALTSRLLEILQL